MLQKKDKLPVVAFTFSRARCDSNADSLTTLDLTTSAEKHFIHTFVRASIDRLKGTDKELPQVNRVLSLAVVFVRLQEFSVRSLWLLGYELPCIPLYDNMNLYNYIIMPY